MEIQYTKRSYPYFSFKAQQIVQVRATGCYTTILDWELCDGLPCYLTDLGEYWQEELRSLAGLDEWERYPNKKA